MLRRSAACTLGIIPFSHCSSSDGSHQRDARSLNSTVYDVAVIGAGVVGLAVARECAVRGQTVVVIERDESLVAGASSGNSGIGCTGYDAPVGSLERRLLRRSIQLHPHLYRSFGLSYDHVRKCGSLVVAWTPEQVEKLTEVLEDNRCVRFFIVSLEPFYLFCTFH